MSMYVRIYTYKLIRISTHAHIKNHNLLILSQCIPHVHKPSLPTYVSVLQIIRTAFLPPSRYVLSKFPYIPSKFISKIPKLFLKCKTQEQSAKFTVCDKEMILIE